MAGGFRASGGSTVKKPYTKGLELAVRIIEILEKNKDLVFAREQIFEHYKASPKSREIATVITNEVGRKWGIINRILEEVQGEPLSHSSSFLRAVLRVGTYEVYFERKNLSHFLKSIRPFVMRKANITLLKRVAFVLRKVERFKGKVAADFLEHAFWYYYFPEWIAQRFLEQFGQEVALKLMEEMNKLPRMTLRTNTRKISPEELAQRLKEKYNYELEVIEYPFIRLSKMYPIMKTDEYKEGLFTVQDVNTAKGIMRLLSLLPEKAVILDACAAPGRKSSLVVQERPDIKLYCVDISRIRIKRLIADFERLKLPLPELICADAAKLPLKLQFDAVHADLPCSGSGTWGKHPERRWLTTPERYKECVEIQRRILSELVHFVKPGGYLLYSTCSLWKEENEENVKWLTETFSEFEVLEIERIFPENASTAFFYAILKKRSTQ